MELGQKLKTARLEAGLSQRQLCGDIITRNMLSQIENGTAQPSFATLQALCARLGKPVSYFREDAPSENLSLLHKASSAPAEEALHLLRNYLSPDPMLDLWYFHLLTRCYLDLARQALSENRTAYCSQLLLQAEEALQNAGNPATFCRQLALLRFQAGLCSPSELAQQLPDNFQEQFLRASAAMEQGEAAKCLACLDSADRQTAESQLLRADALKIMGQYEAAIHCLTPLEETYPEVLPRLEQCYKELGNYEKAYEYACKQR